MDSDSQDHSPEYIWDPTVPDDMDGFYRRYLTVVTSLFPFVLAALRDRRRFLLVGGPREPPRRVHEERARRLTETLLALGPAFIKVGQVLSTRPDLVPPIYAETLRTLQNEVPEDIGGDPTTVLREAYADEPVDLDSLEPVAGGSLAFVYTARRTTDGERIAFKVRRPGIVDHIERDLAVIRKIVPFAVRAAPEAYRYSLRNVADDFEEIIGEELNFEREARMMREIRSNLADDDRVTVPWVDEELSTERVVAMEYVEGVKITDHGAIADRGLPPADLADLIAEVYLQMGLDDGVFHADPHPGNLAVTSAGRLAIYDFGMCQELSPRNRTRIVDLYVALARRDVDGLVDALIALDVLEPDVDRRRITTVLELTVESLRGRSEVDWRVIFETVTADLRAFPFRIPPDVMLLVRVGTVGEGVCRELDPEFNFLEAAREYLATEGHLEAGVRSVLENAREDLAASVPAAARLPKQLSTAIDRVDRGELVIRTEAIDGDRDPVGDAVLAAGLMIAGALLVETQGAIGVTVISVGVLLGVVFLRRAR